MRRRSQGTSVALVTTAAAGMLLLSACGSGSASAGGSAGSAGSGGSSAAHSGAPATHSGSGGGKPAASGRVTVAATTAGHVLVDPHGMTLYAFAPDSRGHSTCTGSCATYWPPVPGSDASHASSRVTAHLGTIRRTDGSSQLTVNGYPMYTYAGDSAPGQATGQGKDLSGGLWWVVAADGSWVKTHGTASSAGGGRGMY